MKGRPLDLSTGLKRCPDCTKKLPLTDFFKAKYSKHGLSTYCRACMAKRHDTWRRKNLAVTRLASAKWREENPRRAKDHTLKARYGIPLGTYDRLFEEQIGQCACCGTNKPGGRGDFHVDHCHETGRIRGLLCHGCNVGLGSLKHDVTLLTKALNYLAKR
jgi:Recombination endonuclease VII